MNVLFVCTGNICRSPMAERLAARATDDESITFSSAGIGTHGRARPSSGTVAAMAEIGIDVSGHRSRSVWDTGEDADVIFALSFEHRLAMLDRWPHRGGDIHLLRPDGKSIADPYGMMIDDYRATRDEIDAAVRQRAAQGWAPQSNPS